MPPWRRRPRTLPPTQQRWRRRRQMQLPPQLRRAWAALTAMTVAVGMAEMGPTGWRALRRPRARRPERPLPRRGVAIMVALVPVPVPLPVPCRGPARPVPVPVAVPVEAVPVEAVLVVVVGARSGG